MAWQVPVFSQRTLALCWEACARMLWGWRYKNSAQSWNVYAQKSGAYGRMNVGLSEQQMDTFYRQLGIRSLKKPSGRNIRHALKWSPVIVTSIKQAQGHALVVTGHNSGKYAVVNPCAVQVVNFDEASGDLCTAASKPLPESEIDSALGQYIWYW